VFLGIFRKKIINTFRGRAVAEVEVHAGDDGNAEDKAVSVCRQTIDAINFFADSLVDYKIHSCVSILGEGAEVVSILPEDENVNLITCFRQQSQPAEPAFRFKGRMVSATASTDLPRGPLLGLPLPKNASLDSSDAFERALARISLLLEKAKPTAWERRLLSSLRWAGRATVERKPEQAFILYMMSLECLLINPKNKSEIGYQLALRTAHLLRGKLEARKKLRERIKVLYNLRSTIVHAGLFRVSDDDLYEVRYYCKRAIMAVLQGKDFCNMSDDKAFDLWIEDKIISSSDDK
jgi:hypothetical protein